MNYYNEFDPFAADWLENLITEGLIPNGEVDRRSIAEVQADDIRGFTQVHFFAGIGGWSFALRLAGWPSERPIWTGSCPCQPFSAAGKGKAQKDERHLWPEMYRLIREFRPDTIAGEQVSSAIGHGWLDGISDDLETEGYAVGSIVLGAFSVGAPHKRSRLYWVAKSSGTECRRGTESTREHGGTFYSSDRRSTDILADANERRSQKLEKQHSETQPDSANGNSCWEHANGCDEFHAMADSHKPIVQRITSAGQQSIDEQDGRISAVGNSSGEGHQSRESSTPIDGHGDSTDATSGTDRRLEHATSNGRDERGAESIRGGITSGCGVDGLGEPIDSGLQRYAGDVHNGNQPGRIGTDAIGSIAASGAWSDYRIVQCLDGKSRRVGCDVQCLAHGIPKGMGSGVPELGKLVKGARNNRVGRLKGYGNAIVPVLAAEFIKAFMDVEQ